jgi:hypothetical protein
MSSRMRAAGPLALAVLVLLAACGAEDEAAGNLLAPVIAHLQEHGFEVAEVPARGEPSPVSEAVVRLHGGTAAIYAYATETAARAAAAVFAKEEQAAPRRVRVQRESAHVFGGRAAPGARFPAMDFEDVVFTAESEKAESGSS